LDLHVEERSIVQPFANQRMEELFKMNPHASRVCGQPIMLLATHKQRNICIRNLVTLRGLLAMRIQPSAYSNTQMANKNLYE